MSEYLTRPIIGIENRSPQEVFDIMVSRIEAALNSNALVPVTPPDALLKSMAIRYDHGLGVPGYYDQRVFGAENIGHAKRMENTISTMRQLHEEVVGKGFYKQAAEDQ